MRCPKCFSAIPGLGNAPTKVARCGHRCVFATASSSRIMSRWRHFGWLVTGLTAADEEWNWVVHGQRNERRTSSRDCLVNPTTTRMRFNRHVVLGDTHAVNPDKSRYQMRRVRFADDTGRRVVHDTNATRTHRRADHCRNIRQAKHPSSPAAAFGKSFDDCFQQRIAEADAFYDTRIPSFR